MRPTAHTKETYTQERQQLVMSGWQQPKSENTFYREHILQGACLFGQQPKSRASAGGGAGALSTSVRPTNNTKETY